MKLANYSKPLKNLLIYVPLLALIFSLICQTRSCIEDRKNEKREYLLNSINNYPRLELINIDDSLRFNANITIADSVKYKNILIPRGTIKYFLEWTIELVNKGNQVAHPIATVMAESENVELNLRTRLLSGDLWDKANIKITDKYFKNISIPPGGSFIINVSDSLVTVGKDSTLAFHLMLFYKNDMNNLYDTYCALRLKLNAGVYQIKKDLVYKNGKHEFSKEDTEKLIYVVDHNIDYKAYNYKESKKLREYLDEYYPDNK